MKRISLLILGLVLAFQNLALELHPEDDCITLKTNLTAEVGKLQQQNSDLRFNNNYILTSRVPLLYATIDGSRQNDTSGDNSGDWERLRIIANGISNTSYQTFLTLEQQYDQIQSVFSSIQSVDCSSCPSSSTNCCDFTEILQAIASVKDSVDLSVYGLSVISNQLNSLDYTNFLLEHGFGSVTNLLFSTNELDENVLDVFYYNWLSQNGNLDNSMFSYYIDGITSVADLLRVINNNISEELPSLNNYNYNWQYRIFPNFTNQFSSYRRDFSSYSDETTNFFSFFRGEIGVQGVLEDWTNEESDGTYHDFLTNHYINVVRGGSLSGNSSSKTNWFSRIETLLASLVFLDSSNTNAYDSASQSVSNGINRVKDDFNSTLDGVSSASSTQMELVSDIEKSMYESLRSFSQAFSSASLPSSVRLIYVYKTSGNRSLSLSSDTVDVTVPVEGKLMDFVEIIRSATTLCWVFFGLWFMFKFSVWTVKKIYMLIRYIIDFFNMVAGGK